MIKNPHETAGKESYIDDASHVAHSQCRKVLFPVKVVGIVDEIGLGKFGTDNRFTFIMNSKFFMEWLREYSNPQLTRNAIFDNLWSSKTLRELSTHIFFNMPDRLGYYLTLNYAKIQKQFSMFSSDIMYFLGFTQIDIRTPIEGAFYDLRYGAMFFQLIMDVILLVLVILSIMLLYSLLVISVDTRTFEMGILRMIGMKRSDLIKLLINQSLSYSVPSWLLGIILAEIGVVFLLVKFSDLVGYELVPIISLNGFLNATAVGLLIPLIASVLPIKNALNTNLHDAIDVDHKAGPQMIEYEIERSEQSKLPVTVILVGIMAVVFGLLSCAVPSVQITGQIASI